MRREIIRSLGLVFGLTLVLAAVQLALPWLSSGMQVALAIILLQVPSWVLRHNELDQDALGLTVGPWRKALRLGLLTMAVIFPLFALGYHVVHTEILDRRADWSLANLARWDESLEHAPTQACDRSGGQTSAWMQGDGLWVVAPPAAQLAIHIDARPPIREARAITCVPGKGPRVGPVVRPAASGDFELRRGEGLWVSLGERDRFEAKVSDGSVPIPAERLRLGTWSASADDDGVIAASKDAWWILTYIIVHLGLVALPEEWFFRGYLQGRLDGLLGTRRRLLGAQVGWGLVLSALAFALLHPILLPGAHRLLVFFPALLFGWLRARSGNVGAAILVHAGSNVLLAMVSRMYL